MRGEKRKISKYVFVEHHRGDSVVDRDPGGVSGRPAGGEGAARLWVPKARILISSSPRENF